MNAYKGYTATVEYDASANRLHGRVDNVSSVISFVAASTEELQREFEISVDEYLAFCAERGMEPEKPCSGRLHLRMEPSVHRAAAAAARSAGKSLNVWINEAIRAALGWPADDRSVA